MRTGDLVSLLGINDDTIFGVILEIWVDVSPARRVDEIDYAEAKLMDDNQVWLECLWEDGIFGVEGQEVMVVNEAR